MSVIQPCAAWLTVNRACNFRCRWCYAETTTYDPRKKMSLGLATTLAQIAVDADANEIILIGGEPTLWDSLFQFNDFCNENDISTTLVTNATLFGSDRFWDSYQESPNINIGVSLKGASPSHLFEVAGVNNFERTRKGLTRALSDFRAGLSITYNSFYVDHLVEMVQFALDCGAESVTVDFCTTTFNNGKAEETYMVKPKDLAAQIMRDYSRLDELTSGKIVFELMLPLCLWPIEFIDKLIDKNQIISVCQLQRRSGVLFDEDGRLLLCNVLLDYPIGNYGQDFTDGNSLLELLNNPRIQGYYDSINCYPSPLCVDCRLYQVCGGGCPLRWTLYHPDDIVRPFV